MHGRKHLFDDGAIIEVVDEEGRAIPPGEMGARLLLTIFERHTQPLIRYAISDRVRLTGEQCPCGRPFRVIECIEGRQEDVLYFPPTLDSTTAAAGVALRASADPQAGTAARASADTGAQLVAIHPNRFHDTLERFAVTAWQVVHDDRALTVRLLGANDPSLRDAIEREIRAMLTAAGAYAPRIEVLAVDQLERGATGKAPLILSRRSRSPATRH
jgi:phenylacetate-coenzyme A ligase PaaK-like adenylate-forming protein